MQKMNFNQDAILLLKYSNLMNEEGRLNDAVDLLFIESIVE